MTEATMSLETHTCACAHVRPHTCACVRASTPPPVPLRAPARMHEHKHLRDRLCAHACTHAHLRTSVPELARSTHEMPGRK